MGTRTLTGLVVAAVVAAGCSDSSGPTSDPGFGLMISTTAAGRGNGPGFAAPESVTVGQHRLILTKVELVLREIELERVAGSANCGSDSDDAPSAAVAQVSPGGTAGTHHDDDRDGCPEVEIGPLLVDLPLGGGVERLVVATIDTGTYREVEFKIHKVGSRSDDQPFLAAHPEFAGISIRATGTYDGTPFEYRTSVTAKQESELDPPLVVATDSATSVTLQVEVASWFLAGGIGLINPATALDDGPNASLVRQNIRRSFRVFGDRNRDGKRDD